MIFQPAFFMFLTCICFNYFQIILRVLQLLFLNFTISLTNTSLDIYLLHQLLQTNTAACHTTNTEDYMLIFACLCGVISLCVTYLTKDPLIKLTPKHIFHLSSLCSYTQNICMLILWILNVLLFKNSAFLNSWKGGVWNCAKFELFFTIISLLNHSFNPVYNVQH